MGSKKCINKSSLQILQIVLVSKAVKIVNYANETCFVKIMTRLTDANVEHKDRDVWLGFRISAWVAKKLCQVTITFPTSNIKILVCKFLSPENIQKIFYRAAFYYCRSGRYWHITTHHIRAPAAGKAARSILYTYSIQFQSRRRGGPNSSFRRCVIIVIISWLSLIVLSTWLQFMCYHLLATAPTCYWTRYNSV